MLCHGVGGPGVADFGQFAEGLRQRARAEPTASTNDDGSFRLVAELCDVFSQVDLDGSDDLITYCTIGGRAATALLVLTHLLGRDRVRVYDGSWAEWGRTPGVPVQCS